MAKLFGTDGVRGIVNKELTADLALRIGMAVAAWARHSGRAGPVVIARDTRRSGDMLQAAIAAGICSGGLDPVDLGVLPTPGLAWCTRHLGAVAGIMISASHNPPEYNGIKIVSAEGFKLPDEDEQWLEQYVAAGIASPAGAVEATRVGALQAAPEAADAYGKFLLSCAVGNAGGMRIVIDCGHGAAYRLAPRLMTELGAEVTVINDQPDGVNINQGCGSTHPEVVAAAVAKTGAQLGFSFDGDADRCIAVDELGNVVDGDQIVAITALHRFRQGRLPGNGVAATVMSNLGLELALRDEGITLYRTPVGDRHVLEEMQNRGLVVGGEQSGHIVFLDKGQTTGDGMLTAIEVLNVMLETGRPLSELAAVVKKVPQRLENVKAADGASILQRRAVQEVIAAMKERLGDQGRILVRPSGTEPVIRVMVEALDEQLLSTALQEIVEVIRRESSS